MRASINFLFENCPRFIETVCHAHVVIADSRQQEDHRAPRYFVRPAGQDSLRALLAEGGDAVLTVGTDQTSSVRKRLASDLQGVSHVTHVHRTVTVQELP